MPDDGYLCPVILTDQPGDLLKSCIYRGIIKSVLDGLTKFVVFRLIYIIGVRIEIDSDSLCQDRCFGRYLFVAGRNKTADLNILLIREHVFVSKFFDDREIHNFVNLTGVPI